MEIKNLLGDQAPKHIQKVWGEATTLLFRYRRIWWIDLPLLLGLLGLALGALDVAGEWTGQHRAAVEIDLSPWALPKYTFFSFCRGFLAYLFSFLFALGYGYWAAKDRVAEKLLLPLLDILQSVPVLGFMPGLVLALDALFPHSNVGLELAAVLMIFTSQAWNMVFSLYQSLRSMPQSLVETAVIYRFSPWQRITRLELPFAAIGLIWNSVMSMAGGWFFLMINESFVLGDKDFRLPGLGSYMSVAVAEGNVPAMLWAIVAMVLMIVALDQLLWRPLVVWGQKFRVEEGNEEQTMRSWFLDFLRRSQLVRGLARALRPTPSAPKPVAPAVVRPSPGGGAGTRVLMAVLLGVLVLLILLGSWRLFLLFSRVTGAQWADLAARSLATLGRVMAATLLGLAWTLPVGLKIGLSPRLSRIFQPVLQVMAAFPAPMLFPAVVLLFKRFELPWEAGGVFLMLLGLQWYILFNVVAGAMAIPSDLKEAARVYRFSGWRKFRKFYLPCIFPYLVTGVVTAAGSAWNASIVTEYVTFKGQTLTIWGLGSQITDAAAKADFPMLTASVVVMSVVVVAFSRLVWDRLYRLAEERYSLSK